MQIADRKFLEVTLQVGGLPPRGGQPGPDSQGDWPGGGTELSASQGQQLFLAGKEGMNGPKSNSALFLEH